MPSADVPRSTERGLDSAAVDAALRRLAGAPEAPWLHGEVARRMAERLQLIRLRPTLLLDWWGACGASAAVLQQACPQARRVVVEPTQALLVRSERDGGPAVLHGARRPWWSVLRRGGSPVEVQLDSADLPHGAQMVWANMMLHAVADPPALLARWHQALEVEGFVMFSCLGPGSLRRLRALYRRLGWGPPTQDFVDMHDLGDMLVHAGFADPVMDQELLELRWSSPQALLAELRGMGSNPSPARAAGLRTPRWRDRLLHELETLRGGDGRLGLEFEIAYGHAFKAAPRVRVTAESTVSLDAMKAMVRSPRNER